MSKSKQIYFHLFHIPDEIMFTMIDLKVEIDMGGHDEETIKEYKKAFNRCAELTPIKCYSL